jgi:hypothetical protein
MVHGHGGDWIVIFLEAPGCDAGSVAGKNSRGPQRRTPRGELHRYQQGALFRAIRACALKFNHETPFLRNR